MEILKLKKSLAAGTNTWMLHVLLFVSGLMIRPGMVSAQDFSATRDAFQES